MALHYEEGRYRVRINSQLLADGEKKDDGSETAPSVQLTIKPLGIYDTDGSYQELSYEWDRTVYLPLTEGTIGTDPEKPGWVLQTLQFLGFNGASFALLDPDTEGHHSFVGIEADAICRHEEFQGKPREKWSIYRPGGNRPQAKPLEKKGVRSLDTKFGKLLKAIAGQPKPSEPPPASKPSTKPNGKPRQSQPPTPVLPQGGPAEEDIPF